MELMRTILVFASGGGPGAARANIMFRLDGTARHSPHKHA
jgi:hypothetical protein